MATEKIGLVAEMPSGTLRGAEVEGKNILVVNLDGTFFALGNTCTHMGCPLSNGKLDGKILQCACHGSRFDVTTGEVVGGPARRPEPAYPARVENGEVFVDV
jgi:3-phenylpropionate/trans-cinnamate dioxygenase ferredoxin component